MGTGQFVFGAQLPTPLGLWPRGQANWAVAEEASAVARRVRVKYCIVELEVSGRREFR